MHTASFAPLVMLVVAAEPMDEPAARLVADDARPGAPALELLSSTTTIVEVAAPRVAMNNCFSCLEDTVAAPSAVASNGSLARQESATVWFVPMGQALTSFLSELHREPRVSRYNLFFVSRVIHKDCVVRVSNEVNGKHSSNDKYVLTEKGKLKNLSK